MLTTEYLPSGKRIWIVFQDSNGDRDSKRYCLWFDSRQKAREYLWHVKRMCGAAELSAPREYIRASRRTK